MVKARWSGQDGQGTIAPPILEREAGPAPFSLDPGFPRAKRLWQNRWPILLASRPGEVAAAGVECISANPGYERRIRSCDRKARVVLDAEVSVLYVPCTPCTEAHIRQANIHMPHRPECTKQKYPGFGPSGIIICFEKKVHG